MIRASRLIEAIKALVGNDDPECCVLPSSVLQIGKHRLHLPACCDGPITPKPSVDHFLLEQFDKIDDTKVFRKVNK